MANSMSPPVEDLPQRTLKYAAPSMPGYDPDFPPYLGVTFAGLYGAKLIAAIVNLL